MQSKSDINPKHLSKKNIRHFSNEKLNCSKISLKGLYPRSKTVFPKYKSFRKSITLCRILQSPKKPNNFHRENRKPVVIEKKKAVLSLVSPLETHSQGPEMQNDNTHLWPVSKNEHIALPSLHFSSASSSDPPTLVSRPQNLREEEYPMTRSYLKSSEVTSQH